MWLADKWEDYVLLDAANAEKVERWGKYILRRPDPLAIWTQKTDKAPWVHPDGFYHRSSSGGGKWEIMNKKLPDRWKVKYRDLTFNVKPMGFKHTGLFPEQATNWDWFSEILKNAKTEQKPKVLNLFAYTGGATVAALAAGAEVVHVDASKGMVTWAKENVISSGLAEASIRYIVDDVKKFVAREARRGHKYDGIIMDPPSYGRGPSGELWKIEAELYPLIETCMEIMSDSPLFFLVNCYSAGLSNVTLENVINMTICNRFGGSVKVDEIGLPIGKSGYNFPCGMSARWQGR